MRTLPRVDRSLCRTCSTCQVRVVCRTRAIVQPERGDLPIIQHVRCRACLVCVSACPHGAVVRDEPMDVLLRIGSDGS